MQMIAPTSPAIPLADHAFPGLSLATPRPGVDPRGPTGPHPTLRDAPAPHLELAAVRDLKWSWACRDLDRAGLFTQRAHDEGAPRAGDLALVEVASVGYHTTIVTADNRKLRIYPGDRLVGVFGHRYATDAYEAQADGTSDVSLLTAGGMIGTIRARHRDMGRPTTLAFLGYVTEPAGDRVNLKQLLFRPTKGHPEIRNLLVVVGTGMNAGKTTVVSQLTHDLARRGLRVAACKLTGSVSNRDPDEMRAASAEVVRDFSDYGFPSTYLATADELRGLRETMLTDTGAVDPDVTVMEIADGILQRETEMILSDPDFHASVRGVLLAADSALGALAAVERLRAEGYPILAVSGALTSAPLYVREFQRHERVPVASSASDGHELGDAVLPHLVGPSPRSPGA